MIEKETAVQLGRLVMQRNAVLVEALRLYGDHMASMAALSREAYRAGQERPEVKAEQDKTVMTNEGHKQSAIRFAEASDAARKFLDDVDRILEADGEDEECE